jgi:murein DD-endopeptidase MepM/ murein hydrolase activator NlpD
LDEQKLLAEQQRIEQIVFDSIKAIPNGTYVTAGTVIGRQGCTGLCTGPHLHFGVKINGGMVNPCSQLPGGVLGGCGSGSSLQWPMSGSFVLTSGYGMRWGKMHYGIDIANYQNDAYIKAAQTGWMFKGFEPCNSGNSLCKNGGANYVIICENKTNCNSGKTTLYWHLR